MSIVVIIPFSKHAWCHTLFSAFSSRTEAENVLFFSGASLGSSLSIFHGRFVGDCLTKSVNGFQTFEGQ